MIRLLVHWLLSAVAIVIVARIVPGFEISGLGAAFIAAIVIGFINATLGLVLKIVTIPLTIVTLGIFWFVVNALMLELASSLVRGFVLTSFLSAFIGGIVLTLVNFVLRAVFEQKA